MLRLALDYISSHRPDNKQRINWEDPGRDRVVDLEPRILEEDVVLEDGHEEYYCTVDPEEDFESLDEPWPATGHGEKLGAIQNEGGRNPVGTKEKPFRRIA